MPTATKVGALNEADVRPSIRLSVCPGPLAQNGACHYRAMVTIEH